MINFFNKFIPDLSQRAAPLNRLRKKGVKFIWSDEELKLAIMYPPILDMTDFSRRFTLRTDASSCAIGAVCSWILKMAGVP
jgi:hypothetical protein